jgi:O-antigen/teichoic acid export membrane protein
MWFVYSQTFAYLLTAIITFIIVVSKAEFLKLRWSLPFSLMILKKSFPFAILVLLMTFYNRVDAVMLERLLPDGANQSGIYAKAYRLLDASNMIAYLFATLLLPMFAKMIKNHQRVDELVKLAYSLLMVPAFIVAICCFFYSTNIMELLYKQHIEESSQVFCILMFCFISVSTTYIFGTLLTANGNLKELNIMAALGMVLNITLNIILIPHYKAIGSATSSLITQSLTALIQVFLVQRIFNFNINIKFLASLGLFIIGTFLIFLACKQLEVSWIIQLLMAASISIAWAFVSRLISIKSLYGIVKYG